MDFMLSTKLFLVLLVALFLFLLFSIFFTLSYSSHILNHPFVFLCSYLHDLVSRSSCLSCDSASWNSSVNNAFQRACVSSQSPLLLGTVQSASRDMYFSCAWPALISWDWKGGMWEGELRRERGARSSGCGYSQKGSVYWPRLLIVLVSSVCLLIK